MTKNIKTKTVYIVAIIATMVLLGGCVGSNDATSPVSSKPGVTTNSVTVATASSTVAPTTVAPTISPKTTQTKTAPVLTPSGLEKLLVEQSDVPEFPLADFIIVVAGKTVKQYKNSYPLAGEQAVMQSSKWDNSLTHSIEVSATQGDIQAAFINIPAYLQNCEKYDKKQGCGVMSIGDSSYYSVAPPAADSTVVTSAMFSKGNIYVTIKVSTSNKDTSRDLAFFVAEKINGRLK